MKDKVYDQQFLVECGLIGELNRSVKHADNKDRAPEIRAEVTQRVKALGVFGSKKEFFDFLGMIGDFRRKDETHAAVAKKMDMVYDAEVVPGRISRVTVNHFTGESYAPVPSEQ